jgi:hypothetical protein
MEEAREQFEEALQIRRELAEKSPESYLPDLAGTLNNLGNLDMDQHRMEEGRKALEEALQIRRELAQKSPDPRNLPLSILFSSVLLSIISQLSNSTVIGEFNLSEFTTFDRNGLWLGRTRRT